MYNFAIAQTFGILGIISSVLSMQMKKRRHILIMLLLLNLFSALNFLFLESYTSFLICAFAVIEMLINYIGYESKKKKVEESCDKLSPQEIGYLTRLYGYEYGLSLKDAQKQIKSMSPEKQCELYTVLKQGFKDNAKRSFYED